MKNILKRSYSLLFFVFLIVLGFSGYAEKAYASITYIQVYPTMDTTGQVNLNDSLGYPNVIYGVRMFSGTFNTGSQGCSQNANNTWNGIMDNAPQGGFGEGMESGFWNCSYGTTSDGDYYVFVNTSGSANNPDWTNGTVYWFTGHRTGGVWTTDPFVPPNTTSRIDTFTYATSTRIANVTGYWNATTTTGITERLTFWQSSTQLGQESYAQITATTTGAFNYSFEFLGLPTPYTGSTTTAPVIAPYQLHASLDQYNNAYYDPFGTSGLNQSLYITNLDLAVVTVSTLTYGLTDFSTASGLQAYPEYECGITSITGCLKNAGIWLFYPGADTVEQFKSLSTDLAGKFPFAYAYGVNTLRQELWNSTQTSTTTIALAVKLIPGHATSSIELLSATKLSAVPYAGLIKTILGWILWLFAIEFIYYRVIRSHDPNTPQ